MSAGRNGRNPDAAGDRQEREQQQHPAMDSRPSPTPPLPTSCGHAYLRPTDRSSHPHGSGKSTARLAIGGAIGGVPRAASLDIERPFGIMQGQGGASDQARRRAKSPDPRLHRSDAARARLSAVGARDRAWRSGSPPPPPSTTTCRSWSARAISSGAAPRARAIRLTPDGRDTARPLERARAAGRRRRTPGSCRSSARSPQAVPSRPTGRLRVHVRPGHAGARAATRTSSRFAATR